METQNQIKRTRSEAKAIEQINRILDTTNNIKITKLADLLCAIDLFNLKQSPVKDKENTSHAMI